MLRRDRPLVPAEDGLIEVPVDRETLALLEAEAAKAGVSITDYFRTAAVSSALRARAVAGATRRETRALWAESQPTRSRARALRATIDARWSGPTASDGRPSAPPQSDAQRSAPPSRRESVFRATPDWSEIHPLYSGGCCSGVMSLGSWLATCVEANDRSRVAAAVHQAIEQRSVVELEYGAIRSDGLTGTAYLRAVPLVGDDGEVTEWLAAAREDIHEGRIDAAVAAI